MASMPPPLLLLPRPLADHWVGLEPLARAHREPLRAVLDRDAEAWSLHASCGMGDAFDGWWRDALRTPGRLPYAIRDLASGRIVGTSSFLELTPAHRRLEIGATFLHPDVRGGYVNPAAKRLMLGAAFTACALRVELVTDARNLRSQAAIAKLGAVREGVLRAHKVTWTGWVRDTVVFSITAPEWPAVRDRLDARLAAFA